MRWVQNIRVMLVIVLVGVFSCHGLHAQYAATNSESPTFRYKETRSYVEMTNSIQRLPQRLDSAEKTMAAAVPTLLM